MQISLVAEANLPTLTRGGVSDAVSDKNSITPAFQVHAKLHSRLWCSETPLSPLTIFQPYLAWWEWRSWK
jgi:hypothetical protein